MLNIKIVESITCPNGHGEMVPGTENLPIMERRFQIRAFKVGDADGHWWSECLVCKRWFSDTGEWERPVNPNGAKLKPSVSIIKK